MTVIVSKPLCLGAEILSNAGLRSQILVPTDPEYDAREESYWSNSAKVKPACIVQPRSAKEVAIAVNALAAASQKFVIRSGGHANWPGSNNMAGGVTVDLGLLNTTTFDGNSEIVSIGPGSRWREVYSGLDKFGRVVAGDREGNAGVAGLLLGGGNTSTARQGFACDNIVSYKIVLADGRIVTAYRDNHAGFIPGAEGKVQQLRRRDKLQDERHRVRRSVRRHDILPKTDHPGGHRSAVRFYRESVK